MKCTSTVARMRHLRLIYCCGWAGRRDSIDFSALGHLLDHLFEVVEAIGDGVGSRCCFALWPSRRRRRLTFLVFIVRGRFSSWLAWLLQAFDLRFDFGSHFDAEIVALEQVLPAPGTALTSPRAPRA